MTKGIDQARPLKEIATIVLHVPGGKTVCCCMCLWSRRSQVSQLGPDHFISIFTLYFLPVRAILRDMEECT